MLFIIICKMMKKLSRNQKQKFETIYQNYKNFASLSYLSVEFSAKLFNFNRRFSMTMKASIFFAIENAIVDRRIWNFSTMRMKLNQLFNRNTSRSFIEKIKANILKIMFEFLNAIKQVKKWCFRIKSFWVAENVVADHLISSSKTNKEKKN